MSVSREQALGMWEVLVGNKNLVSVLKCELGPEGVASVADMDTQNADVAEKAKDCLALIASRIDLLEQGFKGRKLETQKEFAETEKEFPPMAPHTEEPGPKEAKPLSAPKKRGRPRKLEEV